MSEFEELDQRLAAALDRIEAGAGNGGADTAEIDKIRADHQAALAQLEEGLVAQRQTGTALDTELQRLREVNRQLEENNRALREACQFGQIDAALINQAMLAELESLRAARATEKAEVDAALAAIEPLLVTTEECA